MSVVRLVGVVLGATILAAACAKEPPPTAPPTTTAPTAVTWLSDDWSGALTRAKAEGKRVVVDAWAPWCHTCLSMKREVLHAPSLASFADQFVFVEMDTDRPENAAFTVRFPIRTWPTFLVVDPSDERPIASYPGSMSLPEFTAFLRRAATPGALAQAHTALFTGEPNRAAELFTQEVGRTNSAEALISALRALREAKRPGDCVDLARAHLGDVTASGAAGDVVSWMLTCKGELPADDARRPVALAAAEARLRVLVDKPTAGSSVDDRADVMSMLADVLAEKKDMDGVRAVHTQRIALLEQAAAQAQNPEDARVFDYARMGSYLALGRGDDAVALFTERTQQFPQSYEAWARLASTLVQLKRFSAAVAPAQRAVTLSYGPRQLRYLKTLADAHAGAGDAAGAARAWRDLLAANERLPEALQNTALANEAKVALRPR